MRISVKIWSHLENIYINPYFKFHENPPHSFGVITSTRKCHIISPHSPKGSLIGLKQKNFKYISCVSNKFSISKAWQRYLQLSYKTKCDGQNAKWPDLAAAQPKSKTITPFSITTPAGVNNFYILLWCVYCTICIQCVFYYNTLW